MRPYAQGGLPLDFCPFPCAVAVVTFFLPGLDDDSLTLPSAPGRYFMHPQRTTSPHLPLQRSAGVLLPAGLFHAPLLPTRGMS
jgi:hypothetical protein